MNIRQMKGERVNAKNSRAGFTLVEVLVTVMIFAVLAAAINTVLLVGQSSFQVNSVRTELVQDLRKAISRMENDLRQTGPSAIIGGPVSADDAEYESITFYMTEGVIGNSIDWSDDTTQFILGGASSNQLQCISGGDTVVIANNISDISFMREAAYPDVIVVSIQAQKSTVKGIPLTIDFGFGVQMRN